MVCNDENCAKYINKSYNKLTTHQNGHNPRALKVGLGLIYENIHLAILKMGIKPKPKTSYECLNGAPWITTKYLLTGYNIPYPHRHNMIIHLFPIEWGGGVPATVTHSTFGILCGLVPWVLFMYPAMLGYRTGSPSMVRVCSFLL